MVKVVGMMPEGEGSALVQRRQPLSSPEWNFPSIARPKTKRVGTPHPEKAQRALKRAGLESGSEVSRAKKKMVFEMAHGLINKLHGEGRGSPDVKQALIGEMLSSLAQMAKDEKAPTKHLEGLDGEGMAGMAPAPASAGRNRDVSCLEYEMVNKETNASTAPHVTPRLEDGLACDSQKKEKTKVTLLGQENDGPFEVNVILNSKSAPCAIHTQIGIDGDKRDNGTDGRPPEYPPENLVPPANAWKEAKNLFAHGGTGCMVGASTPHNTHKDEPIPLDAGKVTPLGTAGDLEGTPYLSFTDVETKYLSEKLGLAIVGKFSHSLPSSFQIQKSLGGMGLVGSFTWKYLNAKHILLQFQDMADYAKVLSGPNGSPVWFVDIHPMRVFKWAPDFDTFFESPIVAVWCNIMGVPAHLFEVSALMAIGKLLGKPLQADHATINQTRLSFARICVEIDISNPPTEEIILNILGKESRHKVAWDRIPLFCANCKHVGHVIDKCHALGKKGRVGSKDYRTPTKVHHTNHDPKIIRREWRRKEANRVGTSSSIDHTNKEKDSGNQEKVKERVMDAEPLVPRASLEIQSSVDEDGFQLVSRKRKGKTHKGDMHSKALHLDNLRLKDNVATVSFDKPSTWPMNVSCGLPNREKEGFIEELDPGETVHRGGSIPIAGLN